ncbi:hypothetical protein VUR80DRAFT_8149 [Thermomyces stellatus]
MRTAWASGDIVPAWFDLLGSGSSPAAVGGGKGNMESEVAAATAGEGVPRREGGRWWVGRERRKGALGDLWGGTEVCTVAAEPPGGWGLLAARAWVGAPAAAAARGDEGAEGGRFSAVGGWDCNEGQHEGQHGAVGRWTKVSTAGSSAARVSASGESCGGEGGCSGMTGSSGWASGDSAVGERGGVARAGRMGLSFPASLVCFTRAGCARRCGQGSCRWPMMR